MPPKKNLIKKIYIYTFEFIEQKILPNPAKFPKIGIAKNTFGVGEKWNVNTFS